ncbi:MAG: hypothetical protein WBW82_08590 [Candidatus Sulfotelmatobacter sp.]
MTNNAGGGRSECKAATLLYEQCQQSAEHHDTLLWEVTYIVWGSTLLLLGFVLEAIGQHPLLCLITSLLSIFMTVMVHSFTGTFAKIRDYKYDICKKIEGKMQTQWNPHADVDRHYSVGLQKK